MDNFKKYIKQYANLKEEDWQEISKHLTQKLIKKGEMILEQGKICKSVYFLEEGLLRFFVWKEGNDISKFFKKVLRIKLPAKKILKHLKIV